MPISKHRIKAQAGCIRRVILLCLCSSTLALVCADNRVANRSNSTQVVEFPTEITDSNTTTTNVKSTGKQQVEPLAAAPSVTSVHRVWTSTSSGSLDELSPEMIGKLRNDMPFLSAYALRPRLVGGPQVASEELSAALTKQRSAEISRLQPGQLESSAATNAAIRRVPGESLVPKLGDFSEFKVETSSTSKSEHHHKRSTSLKRKPNAPGSKISSPLGSRLSRRSLNRTKKKSNPPSKTRKMSSKGRKKYRKRASRNVRGESSKRRTGSRKRSLKLRDKRKRAKSSLPHRINIIRHGRYIQEQTIGANNDSNVLDVDMRAVGRDTTTTTMLSGSGTKSGDTGGTKGGADSSGVASGARRRPFYENAKPIPTPETNDIDEGDLDRSNPADKADDMRSGSNDANADDLGEDEVLDDDVADEPRRVGDPDVDEEGDTVLVEPKSDGVDDDPPIESAEEDGASEADNTEDDAETGNDVGTGSSTVPDAGSRRTGRDKPRVRDDEGSENEEDSNVDDRGDERSRGSAGSSGSTDFSGGGGIGATIGGSGGSSGRGAGRESESGSDGNSDDNDNPADRRRVGASPGVEFADGDSAQGGSDGSAAGGSSSSNGSDERDDDSSSAGSSSNSGEKSSGSGREDDVDDRRNDDKSSQDPSQENSIDVRSNGKRLDDSDLDYETEKEADIGRTGSRGVDGRGQGEGDDDDLDYRDETDDRSRGDRTNNRKAHPSVGVSNDDERDKDDHERGDKRGHKGTECEDKDHHGDDHHHHHHGIEWLRGAIPGEPGVDYPILSRVNSTDFSCRDQKYPGYYADVESRCQVSSYLLIESLR